MTAYEKALNATSSRDAPWYVVPADDKRNAHLIVSQVLLETFETLDLEYPQTGRRRRRELLRLRSQLEK
jgi:hypothetical protein